MTRKNTPPEKLQDSFEEHSERFTDIEYRHPQEDRILPALKTILAETGTGKHLLKVIDEANIAIYLIKYKGMRGGSADGRMIFLCLPEEKSEPEPQMVLELAAGLREAEQEHLGYPKPDANTAPLEFAAISHAKNLDIVVHMCKVAYELQQSADSTAYVDVLEKLGHGGIYDAYVRDFAPEKIVDVYHAQDSR